MVRLSATRCNFIAILGVSLVNFTAITLCVASQRVFIVVVYFVIESVQKILDTPSYFIDFLKYYTSQKCWLVFLSKKSLS
jgi:hypothetical protein